MFACEESRHLLPSDLRPGTRKKTASSWTCFCEVGKWFAQAQRRPSSRASLSLKRLESGRSEDTAQHKMTKVHGCDWSCRSRVFAFDGNVAAFVYGKCRSRQQSQQSSIRSCDNQPGGDIRETKRNAAQRRRRHVCRIS